MTDSEGRQVPQPSPRDNLDQALDDVRAAGVGIVAGVLDERARDALRDALWLAVEEGERAGEVLRGVPALDPNTSNVRVFHLLNHDRAFARLALHELALRAATDLLETHPLLSNLSANIALPGSESMPLHADQGYALPPWPPQPLAVNVMWLLDEYTDEVGATRYVPGSVHSAHGPLPGDTSVTVPIEAPAGSVVVMDSRVWHTSGRNSTADRQRAAIFAYYVRPWIRQQVNWTAVLSPSVVASAPPGLLELVGYAEGNDGLRRALVESRAASAGAGSADADAP